MVNPVAFMSMEAADTSGTLQEAVVLDFPAFEIKKIKLNSAFSRSCSYVCVTELKVLYVYPY